MKNLLLEKKISNPLATLQKQSQNLRCLFEDNTPLSPLLRHTEILRRSLRRLDSLLIERFIKTNMHRYKYPGDRAKFIEEIVRLHRCCA